MFDSGALKGPVVDDATHTGVSSQLVLSGLWEWGQKTQSAGNFASGELSMMGEPVKRKSSAELGLGVEVAGGIGTNPSSCGGARLGGGIESV